MATKEAPLPTPEATEANLRAALEAEMNKQKSGSKSDLNMTVEEGDKFTKAFGDPEFRKLMADYVTEISDPKNRAEQDEYIRQLETQGEVPEDKEIIRPEKGFAVKLKHTKVILRDAAVKEKREYVKEKIFINIVSSDKINPPTSVMATMPNGQKGKQYSVPHSLGPLRMEADKGGDNVPTVDCCFHPEALEMGNRQVNFRDLLVETARDTTEKQFKNMKDDVEIDKVYHVLKGISYKNGEPAVMIVSKTKVKEAKMSSAEAQIAAATPPPPPSQKAAASAPAAPTQPAVQRGFMTAQKTTLKDGKTTAKNGGGGKRGGGLTSTNMTIPFYTITEQGSFDISQTTMADADKPTSTRPTALVFKIELPDVNSAAELDLDVSDTKLEVTSLPSSDSKYSLEAYLIYPCDGDKGKAKWDKSKKCLVVTIPVRPPNAEELKKLKRDAVEVISDGIEEVKLDDVVAVAVAVSLDDEANAVVKKSAVVEKKSTREAFATDAPIPVNNAAAEMYEIGGVDDNVIKNEEVETQEEVDAVDYEDFTACKAFEGKRAGFVFKLGDQGVGYYLDSSSSSMSKSKSNKPSAKPTPKPAAPKLPAPLAPKAPPSTLPSTKSTQFYPNDPYEYRQSAKTVTILLQVAGIDAETVKTTFTDSAVTACFRTFDGKPHEFCLDLAHGVVSSECGFDVTTKNMCVVLVKKDGGMAWDTLELVEKKSESEKEESKVKEKVKEKGKAKDAKVEKVVVVEEKKQVVVGKKNKETKSKQPPINSKPKDTIVYNAISSTANKLMYSLD